MPFSPYLYPTKVCCQSHDIYMATSGDHVYLLIYFVPVLILNMFCCVTYTFVSSLLNNDMHVYRQI